MNARGRGSKGGIPVALDRWRAALLLGGWGDRTGLRHGKSADQEYTDVHFYLHSELRAVISS